MNSRKNDKLIIASTNYKNKRDLYLSEDIEKSIGILPCFFLLLVSSSRGCSGGERRDLTGIISFGAPKYLNNELCRSTVARDNNSHRCSPACAADKEGRVGRGETRGAATEGNIAGEEMGEKEME